MYNLIINGCRLLTHPPFACFWKDDDTYWSQKKNDTLLFVVKHISDDILIEMMRQPMPLSKMLRMMSQVPNRNELEKSINGRIVEGMLSALNFVRDAIIRSMSKIDPPLFNEIIKRLLVANDRFTIPIDTICRLNTNVLSRYMAQHPEISWQELRISESYPRLSNHLLKSAMEAKLSSAEEMNRDEIQFSLAVFYCLKDVTLPPPLVLIILSYLDRNNSVVDRINYEIIKEQQKTPKLNSIYREIQSHFKKGNKLEYEMNEAEIILNYLADHPIMAQMCIATVKKQDEYNSTLWGTLNSLVYKQDDCEKDKEVTPRKSMCMRLTHFFFANKKVPQLKEPAQALQMEIKTGQRQTNT